MIFTARQLEDLHKTNGHVTLPRAARLTPLAMDWLRKTKIDVVYGESETGERRISETKSAESAASASGAKFLWWCDGPCGPAKAAISAESRQMNLQFSDVPAEPTRLMQAIKHFAAEIKSNRAEGAILLVKTGAAAVVYANRCPSLRAILGTCRDAVDQGVRTVAANVLVIEYPFHTLTQMRNLISQFARGKRELSAETQRQLQELTSCG